MLDEKRHQYEVNHEAEQDARHTMPVVLYVLLGVACLVVSCVVGYLFYVGVF